MDFDLGFVLFSLGYNTVTQCQVIKTVQHEHDFYYFSMSLFCGDKEKFFSSGGARPLNIINARKC